MTHTGVYNYPKWPRGEVRKVEEVVKNEDDGNYTLKIWNPHKQNGAGFSLYNPHNFQIMSGPEQEDPNVAKQQTADRFFAIKLNYSSEDASAPSGSLTHVPMLGYDENGGFHLADVNTDHEVDVNHYDTTPLRNSRTKVTDDVRLLIKEGERWVICEAIAFIDGEPPRPPIKLVELR